MENDLFYFSTINLFRSLLIIKGCKVDRYLGVQLLQDDTVILWNGFVGVLLEGYYWDFEIFTIG